MTWRLSTSTLMIQGGSDFCAERAVSVLLNRVNATLRTDLEESTQSDAGAVPFLGTLTEPHEHFMDQEFPRKWKKHSLPFGEALGSGIMTDRKWMCCNFGGRGG